MPPAGFKPTISAGERPQTYALGYGYIGVRNDTTQQSGQTPDKKEIKNITVYVSGYTETDTTGMLSPPTVWRQQSEFVSSRLSGQILAAVRIGFESVVAMDKTVVGLNVDTRSCNVYPDRCWFAVLCRFWLQCSLYP
jgi:hypothetical protein